MIDATAVRDAATAAETAVNAVLAMKAAPTGSTLEQALAAVATARTAVDAFTDSAQQLGNDIIQAHGTQLDA